MIATSTHCASDKRARRAWLFSMPSHSRTKGDFAKIDSAGWSILDGVCKPAQAKCQALSNQAAQVLKSPSHDLTAPLPCKLRGHKGSGCTWQCCQHLYRCSVRYVGFSSCEPPCIRKNKLETWPLATNGTSERVPAVTILAQLSPLAY